MSAYTTLNIPRDVAIAAYHQLTGSSITNERLEDCFDKLLDYKLYNVRVAEFNHDDCSDDASEQFESLIEAELARPYDTRSDIAAAKELLTKAGYTIS